MSPITPEIVSAKSANRDHVIRTERYVFVTKTIPSVYQKIRFLHGLLWKNKFSVLIANGSAHWYYKTMLFDGLSFDEYARRSNDSRLQKLNPLVNYFERKTGARVVYEMKDRLNDPELHHAAELYLKLKERGIVTDVGKTKQFPDEPQFCDWFAVSSSVKNLVTGGATAEDEVGALSATLAEILERYIWATQRDFLKDTTVATVQEIAKRGAYLNPAKIAGFSSAERKNDPDRALRDDAQYFWVRTHSLVNSLRLYVPAQTLMGHRVQRTTESQQEPLIRQQTSIGIATWPTRIGARLAGALEVIEREAYMVMWLNQLSVPRINLAPIRSQEPVIDRLLTRCERYRFNIHALQMPTDAPTHAICIVLEDLSGVAPRFALGLKSHRSLAHCIEKATLEALRARRTYRQHLVTGEVWDTKTPIDKISHEERLYYWAEPENSAHLQFLIKGTEITLSESLWENDDEEAQWNRITAWCREYGFECYSANLDASAVNPIPWCMEVVVLPDLQPTYLYESMRQLGCDRWRQVAEKLGYTPRATPYTDAPHPYV